ncbi:MAG: N-acetylmuramoyl-L-alanine amidase, partial [Oscillospiraceae bacterium]
AAVQDALRLALNPENHRQAAPISKDVYLMNHISCRAILVECGFLSNPQEDALLQTAEYQTKLAATIAGAYLQFQNMEGERPNVTQS